MADKEKKPATKWEPRRAIQEKLRPSVAPPDPTDTRAVIERYNLSRIDYRMPLSRYTRETLQRLPFIRAYAQAQVSASNNQNALGMGWVVLNPMLNAVVYWLVFGIILRASEGIDNYIAFIVIGIFTIEFSTQCLGAGASAITGNEGLVRALQFPRAVLPLTIVYRELIEHLFSMGVMLVIVLLSFELPRWSWLLLPLVILMQFFFNLSVAFFAARIGNAVQDFNQVVPFIARVWLFLSGVFFSVEQVSAGLPNWFGALMTINPAHVYIELCRHVVMTDYPVRDDFWYLAIAWAVLPLLVAYPFFWRGEQTYGKA